MGQLVQARVLFVALSLAVLVTACGGGGDSGTAPQTSPPPTGGGNPPANHAPTISGQPATALHVGEAYSFMPTAADSDGDTLTFSVTNKPAWMTFNSATGQLTGTPAAGDVGSFSGIALAVSDGKVSASLTAFAVAVTQISTGAATLNWGSPTQNTDGSALTNLSGYRVVYGRAADNLDQSISVTNPSINSTLVSNLSSGTWYFSVVAINAQGTESSRSNVVSTTI
jgi:hypothetical protein